MNDKELKQEITKRWNAMTDHQTTNPCSLDKGGSTTKSQAFYQLEYILIKEGLLAERRGPKGQKAMSQAEVQDRLLT